MLDPTTFLPTTFLAEDSLIRLKNGRVEFLKSPAELSDPRQLKRELDERFPEFNPLFAMLEHCTGHYRDALNGDIEAISVLYPEGESTLLADTLNNTVEHTRDEVYITLLCDLVDKNLEKKPHETLKILEVGAGERGGLQMPLRHGCKTETSNMYARTSGGLLSLNWSEKPGRPAATL